MSLYSFSLLPKPVIVLLTMILFAGCTAPTATSTEVEPSPQAVTATPTIIFTRAPVTKSPTPAPTPDVSVGSSFIGTFQDGELTFLHVSTRYTEFYPETIEILESSTREVLAGPFLLKRNSSGLCEGYYDSKGLNVSELPENFKVQVSSPPYYTFRVTGHRPSGEKVSREIVTTAQFTCENITDPIMVGTSLIEYETPNKEDEYYLHINVLDKEGSFVPESVEIIDPDTNQVVAGPLQLTEKNSELCYRQGYETENIYPLLSYNLALRPDYIYRVRLSSVDGQKIAIEVNEDPYVCRDVLR